MIVRRAFLSLLLICLGCSPVPTSANSGRRLPSAGYRARGRAAGSGVLFLPASVKVSSGRSGRASLRIMTR